MNNEAEIIRHDTPLHHVTDAQAALNLIAQGADVHARNVYGETPLLVIEVYQGDLRDDAQKEGGRVLGLIEVMVAHGADINAQAGEGSLLHKVAAYFYNEMTLDDEGAQVFEKIIKRLVELGADVNLRTAENGDTPLYYAQYNEWQDCCSRILLDCGADINAQNNYGETALIKSILTRGVIRRTEQLIEWGADVNLQDSRGWTALHHAVNKNDAAAVALLLAHGANADIANNEGQTVLQLAEIKGNSSAVRHFAGEPLIGEVESAEEARERRAALRERIETFRNEIAQTEVACRHSAYAWRRKRLFMIAVAVVSVFFGVPGVMMTVTMVVMLTFFSPLRRAIRQETASEICLLLSKELRALMDLTDSAQYVEGQLAAMESLRGQLVKMQAKLAE